MADPSLKVMIWPTRSCAACVADTEASIISSPVRITGLIDPDITVKMGCPKTLH
ncbi:MAG: hypothetical protein ABSF89_04875 [Acidimicrobiales bacterium]|jgi:hypothetical protein